MICIKITSQTSPQDVFQLQENARSLEEWANKTVGSPMPRSEEIKYHEKLGKDYTKKRNELHTLW